MIPGPYAICHATVPDANSDSITYRTLSWGYDTANDAFNDIVAVAQKEGVNVDECRVTRDIDKAEAEEFSS